MERIDLENCSTPCTHCEVRDLSDPERNAVDIVFQGHYQKISPEHLPQTEMIESWAREALKTSTGANIVDPEKAEAVAGAVVRIANGECPNYMEE